MEKLALHYDLLADKRDYYRNKNKYYYELIEKQYKYLIPKNKKILEIGCGTGDLLNALEPSYGVGLDISKEMVKFAAEKYKNLNFKVGDIRQAELDCKFDYIILSGLLGEVDDIQNILESLKKFCNKNTRIIIEYYSCFWQYILKIGEKINLKMPQKNQNWLTYNDINNFLSLSGYEAIKRDRRILIPFNVWLISYLLNKYFAQIPIINALTLNHFIIARPVIKVEKEYSVSILIPCRNEKGNIEKAVIRTPSFGEKQEFIFVEGGSSDGTYQEVERVMKKYPEKNIKLIKQTAKGKGDAVRLGFKRAKGDILMILDADLTMPPEELPKFYQAVKSNKGEFINGCRLIYPMENEAMRFLNLIANKIFGVFFSWLLGQSFKDTLCGTKVLFKDQYEELAANRSYFGDFDPFGDFDLIFGASKLNLKVIELPIRYKSRQYGETQIQRFKHGFLLLRMCFFAMKKIKFR